MELMTPLLVFYRKNQAKLTSMHVYFEVRQGIIHETDVSTFLH